MDARCLMVSLKARTTLFSTLALLLFAGPGCGAASYAYHSVQATRAVEAAKQADARKEAPFEQTLAEAYLLKAKELSSEAQYQDAVRFAERSEEMANKAVEISRRRRQGAGR